MTNLSAQLRQWTAASIASMGLLMTGMFLGWPSPTVSKLTAGVTPLTITDSQVSWMVSLLYVGSVISPLPAGRLMDRWGRRRTLQITSGLALVSWLLLACTTDVVSLFIARVLGGMWGGISYCITPVYLSEIAEPRIRGALNTMFTTMVYLGIMFEYSIGPFLSYNTLNIVSACVPVVYFLAMSTIPESPYYFLMRRRNRAAEESLVWLRCETNVIEELHAISNAVKASMMNKGTMWDLVAIPSNRRALLMTETVAFLQRMSGSSVLMAFVSSAVPQDGPVTGDQCALLMCVLWLVFGVWSTFLVDKLGRRPLLALSCAGCAISTAVLTAWFYILSEIKLNLKDFKIIPFACFGLYAVFFPFGLACIPSIIQGELFPPNVKAVASGLTAIVVAAVSFFNNKLYQPISNTFGMYVNYLYFTLSSVFGIYYAIFVLIETRNKTLQEINFELTNLGESSEIRIPKTDPRDDENEMVNTLANDIQS